MTVINTNVKSLIAADSMRSSNVALAKAMERLSTGKQINSAKDDAAGLAISTRMTAQVRGLNMAIKNANDGINLAQTAEGAMTEITDMLQRMRELAIQSGNTTNSDLDRSAMNEEIKQLQSEINRVAQTTQFNGINILDGTFNGKLQIGNNSGQTMDLAVSSMSTASMGETVNGVATAATKASLSLGGVATSAAAYSGVAFNATVNGVTKNIVLPTAAPANPVVTKALVGADASVSIKPDQVGLFAERTISMVAAGDIAGKLLISVNDGDVGTQKIDVGTAAANLGYDLTKMTGSMTVKAIQTAIDSSIYFTGDNKVTVGQDANDNITFSVAGGAKKIAVTHDATAGTGATLLNLLSGATTTIVATGATASMKAIDGTKPLAGLYAANPAPSDQVEVFGLQQIAITTAATNRTLGIKIGDGQSVSLNLNTTGADIYLDNMSDVASLIQSKINASGNFTGANAVTVSAVKDANSNWGLLFTNATNQKITLSDTFMTVGSGLANTSNNTTTILPVGTTTKVLLATPQFGSFAAKTIDLTGVNPINGLAANNVANGMKAFKLNVNGGGDVVVDMSTALTNMGLSETVTTTAVTQSQFVRAMQTAIDSTGLFVGNNKVTVGVTDSGQVSLTVAGGVGSVVVKENSGTTATTQYDGLVNALAGTNNGVVGNAFESVNTGGKLVLGATYNNNIASSATKPAGQMGITLGATNTGNIFKIILRDSLGNVTTVTTAALAADNDTTDFAAKLNAALGGTAGALVDTGGVASLYTVSNDGTPAAATANKFIIKRNDGVDFTLQLDTLASGNTAVTTVTPDSTSAAALVKGGAPASSSQLVNTFTTGPTRIGAGDGAVFEKVTGVIGGVPTNGDVISFDGFSYTVTPATTAAGGAANGPNATADAFVSAYNAQPDTRFVAARTLATGEMTFTAKTTGNKDNATAVFAKVSGTLTVAGNTRVEGTSSTYNVENVLSLKVGNHSYDVIVAATDYEYSTLSQLKDKVQSSIDQTTGLSGANRVVVGVTTDSANKSGLTFTQATGQELSVSGLFVTNELKVAQTAPAKLVSVSTGGVDLSANNTLSVNLVDANTGASTTKNITLNSTSKNVSLADYAALVQSSINSAFSADGFSVTASSSNGNLSLAMNNQPTKTMTVSGASVATAFGVGSLQASGVPINSMASMSDVVREIQIDLGDVATVAYDAAKGQMTFAATNGTAGTGNTISLSGAGLAAVQFGGTLSATGAAGNATASKLSDINVLTTAAATSALGSIDNSIEYVSKQRALLGAIENRLAHTVNNLTNIVTNTSASRSAIEDTDYSKETSALAKSQIITQAATAMLAQANQSAQSVLSLLK